MSLANFDFPNHTVNHKYPERPQMTFGGGYTFTATPPNPVQRSFTLHFEGGLRWVQNANGVGFSNSEDSENNALRFDQFYAAHEMHKAFNYPHDVYGTLVVRFKQPFQMPKSVKGGSGWTESFSIDLVEDLE
jgi:hypothetical protein